jgi:hypothetical protein
VTARFRTFRKHRRPCGQPAVLGEIERFRPVPPQAGHLVRIKATPSDLPFKSTGFATYPEPPQFGQSSGATPSPPRVSQILTQVGWCSAKDRFVLRIPNKLSETTVGAVFSSGSGCEPRMRLPRTVYFGDAVGYQKYLCERNLTDSQTGSLKILSIRSHFSPGRASGRAF